MRTPEEFTRNLMDTDYFIKDYEKKLEHALEKVKSFEKEIRADQDKLTRHACAENVNKMNGVVTMEHNYDESIDRDEAHSVIMNTNVVLDNTHRKGNAGDYHKNVTYSSAIYDNKD